MCAFYIYVYIHVHMHAHADVYIYIYVYVYMFMESCPSVQDRLRPNTAGKREEGVFAHAAALSK